MLGRLTLTARLTVLYTLVSAIVLLGLGVLVSLATSKHFVELDHAFLQEKVHLVQKIVADAPDSKVLTQRLDELLDSHPGLYLHILRASQTVYAAQDIVFPDSLARNNVGDTLLDWNEGALQLRGMSLEMAAPAGLGGSEGDHSSMRLFIALDTLHHTHFMSELRQTLMFYVLLATLISGFLGWWAARRGLAPLRIMKERAMMVTAHKLNQRMPIDAVPVEMADLAASLNNMLERLQNDFARLMEFSSDLAHELRTPISNLLTQTQVSLAQQRDANAYREILASNAEEFQRLARMVSDMLFLAKTEHGIELPHAEALSLQHEVRALFDFYDAVADEKGIRLILTGEAEILGDRLMVRRAISNLLSNALRHSLINSAVEVTITRSRQQIALCVSNEGPPIPAVHLSRLFDRFYRVDKSRVHADSEGTGLGLSITQAIMNAHKGSASASSGNGRISFCLYFPIGQIAHVPRQ